MSISETLEAILFVASKPLSFNELAKATGKQLATITETIETLKMKYNANNSGIVILVADEKVQMATNPEYAKVVEGFIKQEASGELTKAQLETLTVIAYRSPVSKADVEHIRGVNCTVILRNLLIRGLITVEESDEHILPVYTLSFDALRELGIQEVGELPDYETLCDHPHINSVVESDN